MTQVKILDALFHGLVSLPSVTEFRPPTESSEPFSPSIKEAENPKFSAFIFRSRGLKFDYGNGKGHIFDYIKRTHICILV